MSRLTSFGPCALLALASVANAQPLPLPPRIQETIKYPRKGEFTVILHAKGNEVFSGRTRVEVKYFDALRPKFTDCKGKECYYKFEVKDVYPLGRVPNNDRRLAVVLERKKAEVEEKKVEEENDGNLRASEPNVSSLAEQDASDVPAESGELYFEIDANGDGEGGITDPIEIEPIADPCQGEGAGEKLKRASATLQSVSPSGRSQDAKEKLFKSTYEMQRRVTELEAAIDKALRDLEG